MVNFDEYLRFTWFLYANLNNISSHLTFNSHGGGHLWCLISGYTSEIMDKERKKKKRVERD